MGNIGAQEILIVALIFVVIFGAQKLPETAKGIAQSLRVFKKELRDEEKAAVESTPATGPSDQSQSTTSASTETPTTSATAARTDQAAARSLGS